MNIQDNQPTFAPLDASPQPNAATFQAIYGGEEGTQDRTQTKSTDEYGSMSDSTVDDDDMPNSDPGDDDMGEDDMDDVDEDDSGEMEPETPVQMPDTRVPDTVTAFFGIVPARADLPCSIGVARGPEGNSNSQCVG
jgi:hypothetical protein